jgi:hypothetical protein
MAYRTTLIDSEKYHPGFCASYRRLLQKYLLDPRPDVLGQFCDQCNILLTEEEHQSGSLCAYCCEDDNAEKIRNEKSDTVITMFQMHGDTEPDERDRQNAIERFKLRGNDPKPRVGDYVITPDGSYDRIAYIWSGALQTSKGGSFHISYDGYVSMSGGLDPGFPKEQFHLTDEKKPGYFWFFHHNDVCANNGVGVEAFCRVYRIQ